MKRIAELALLAFLLWLILGPTGLFGQGTNSIASNPLGGNISASGSTCATVQTCVWEKLPGNAGTSVVTIAGSFSGATLPVEASGDGGNTWTTLASLSATGVTTYSTNGYTDIRVRASALSSGIVNVTISTGIQQVQSVVSGGALASGVLQAANAISMSASKYGGFFDVKFCYGNNNTITVTNGQNTVTCSGGPFTPADVGKDIAITTGCCGIFNMSNGGLVIPANTTITGFTSSTTVTVSNNATFTCINNLTNNGSCIIAWGHNDDTAVTAAENDWQASSQNRCAALIWPASAFFIKQPHWNSPPAACVGSEPAIDYIQSVQGFGPGTSIAVIEPGFNFSGCTFGAGSNGCFFSYIEADVRDLGFYGIANGSTGTNNKVLLNPGIGSQFMNVSLVGFGGKDSGALYGIAVPASRFVFLSVDGFGQTNILDNSTNTANTICEWCFAGDSAGPAVLITAGINHHFIDIGGDWGPTQGAQLIYQTGSAEFDSFGGKGFDSSGNHSLTANNGSALQAAAAATFKLHGGNWDNSGCGSGGNCNAIALQHSGAVGVYEGTFLKGHGTGAVFNDVAGSAEYDACGNTFVAPLVAGTVTMFGSCSITGTTLATSNIGLTSGWGTSSVASASGDSHQGTFSITGAAGSSGPTLTLTFPTPYVVAPASCILFETGASDLASLTSVSSGTPSATSVVFTFVGTPVAVTYKFDFRCGP